jgi:hypothetical protein
MSVSELDQVEQKRIAQNIQREAGKRALHELRDIVDEELRVDAAKERFLCAFVKYGWAIMLLVSIVLAYLLGVF